MQLVKEQVVIVQAIAAGVKALPGVGKAFAATQAAWRFFANPRVTLSKLIEPLREAGRKASNESPSPYVLVAHDWSKLDYDGHARKKDLAQLSNKLDWGYELLTALLVDAHDGAPLAPMGISILSAAGMHTTQSDAPQPRVGHLDQILPWMDASREWGLRRRCVHVIDREADSLTHLRSWAEAGHLLVVRGDDRRATFRGQSRLLSEIVETLRSEDAFEEHGDVAIRGRTGRQWVAETEVVLAAPGWRQTADGKKHRVPGKPLRMRFVVVEVRDSEGKLLAHWLLLTNVCDVSALQIALWYYWRWRIESFHKLLKSAGLEAEEWQQRCAEAIAKRLLIGCMACVTVWNLQRQSSPQAKECQEFLVRLSGRQMKRSRPITAPALLAGLHYLLITLETLERYTPEQLREFARTAAPHLCRSG